MDLFLYTSDKANQAVEVPIKHPVTGVDTDTLISIIGIDSPAAQACMDEQQARRFNEMAASGEGVKFDPVLQRGDLISLLVACTVGWKNLQWKGEEFPFTKDNAKFIYEQVPTIREQMNKATGTRKLFFKD